MIGKEIIMAIWSKCPWWIKYPAIILVGPNIIVFSVVFFVWVVPWHKASIHAELTNLEDRQNAQIRHITEKQNIHNQNIMNSLGQIQQHQSIMYQALLNRK